MRKQVIGTAKTGVSEASGQEWFDLEAIATVELTSENPSFPIEAALVDHRGAVLHAGRGWSAGECGPQTITIRFDTPQKVKRVRVHFIEDESERGQEFALRWLDAKGGKHEIVRQQWVFSPGGSTEEVEDYTVQLEGVAAVELEIDPDRGRRVVRATLAELRIG